MMRLIFAVIAVLLFTSAQSSAQQQKPLPDFSGWRMIEALTLNMVHNGNRVQMVTERYGTLNGNRVLIVDLLYDESKKEWLAICSENTMETKPDGTQELKTDLYGLYEKKGKSWTPVAEFKGQGKEIALGQFLARQYSLYVIAQP